jgi:hypothetical protein
MSTRGLMAVAMVACASNALAQHIGDINPILVPANDPTGELLRIETNLFTDAGLVEGARVFDATFGDSGFPEFTSNPGFDAEAGTFTPGTRVGFRAPEGLLRFTTQPTPALLPVTSERLEVSFLTLGEIIGPAPADGFDLAVQSNGGWHRHFSFEIFDESLPLPAPGIYVLPMHVYSTDPMVLESDLLWMVFDYGAGQSAQDEAIAWIEATLLAPPCPADLDGDGAVGPGDLATLLGAWGSAGTSADLDGDGAVGPGDLATLLGLWGNCG